MLTTIKTGQAIALPERRRYPFENMSIGDFMLFQDYRQAESARVAAIRFSKRRAMSWRFGIRKMNDGWRIFRLQ